MCDSSFVVNTTTDIDTDETMPWLLYPLEL